MRTWVCVAALAALAGCDNNADGDNVAAGSSALETASATSSAEAEALGETKDAAEEQRLEWTGRFAATPALCTGGVWDFQPQRVVTDGETSCTIADQAAAGREVTLRLACTAEGTDTNETWTLGPNGTDGINVARNTGTETINVALIRCG